jgi:hypothetical protein
MIPQPESKHSRLISQHVTTYIIVHVTNALPQVFPSHILVARKKAYEHLCAPLHQASIHPLPSPPLPHPPPSATFDALTSNRFPPPVSHLRFLSTVPSTTSFHPSLLLLHTHTFAAHTTPQSIKQITGLSHTFSHYGLQSSCSFPLASVRRINLGQAVISPTCKSKAREFVDGVYDTLWTTSLLTRLGVSGIRLGRERW